MLHPRGGSPGGDGHGQGWEGPGSMRKDKWGNWKQWGEVWEPNPNGEGRMAGKRGV